jgi:hypothetical protein
VLERRHRGASGQRHAGGARQHVDQAVLEVRVVDRRMRSAQSPVIPISAAAAGARFVAGGQPLLGQVPEPKGANVLRIVVQLVLDLDRDDRARWCAQWRAPGRATSRRYAPSPTANRADRLAYGPTVRGHSRLKAMPSGSPTPVTGTGRSPRGAPSRIGVGQDDSGRVAVLVDQPT